MNKRLVFKIKDGYNWELQTPEAMKLFGCTKNSIEKAKKTKKQNRNCAESWSRWSSFSPM